MARPRESGPSASPSAGFELGPVIHRGPRSTVQRATRNADGVEVVLKAAKLGKADREARRRLRHEHTMLEQADGRGGVATMGLATTPLGLTLVLAPAPGVPLRARVGHRRLSLPDFLDIALQITQAIRELHGTGVHHLDIRPENLLTDPSPGGKCVLLDFGRAANAPIPMPESSGLQAKELIYFAPEQSGRLGRNADARSDLYSLGVIFYELLAGEPPLRSDDSLEFIYSLIAQTPRPLAEIRPELPSPIVEIVERLLQKNPEKRYHTAGGLFADLERCRRALDINGSVSAFEIGVADRTGILSLSGRLYGRDAELRKLEEGVELAVQGMGAGAAVVGPAGIGKSALVNELRTWTATRRGWFTSGKFDSLARTDAYGALRSCLEHVLRRILVLPADQLEDWTQRLNEAVGARADALTGLVPLLESFLPETSPVRSLSPLETKTRQQAAVIDLLRALHHREAPLILCLDDLHWADAATLELLEGFLRAPDPGNPVLVLSWRDDEVHAGSPLYAMFERLGRDTLARVELTPLSTEAVAAYLADALHTDAKRVWALADKVTQRSAGNPFFVGVLLGALVDSGVVSFDPERLLWHWRLGELDSVEVPEDIVELLTAQLRTRDSDTLELLAHLSLFAGSVDLGLIALALGSSLDLLAARVAHLGREGMLVLDGDGWQYAGELNVDSAAESAGAGLSVAGRALFVRFPHDKVQGAARLLLDESERARLHWEFGRRLVALGADAWGETELFVAADQLERGHSAAPSDATADTAAAVLRRASKAAFDRAAFARSLSWSKAALDLLRGRGSERERFALHLSAAQAAVVLGRHEERNQHISEAEALAPDEFGRVALERVQIRAELARGEYTAAVDRTVVALGRLGVSVARKPSIPKVGVLMSRTIWAMRGAADKIRQLPVCEDQRITAAIGLMSEAMIAAYLCEPNLAAVFMLEPVNLTLRHGVTPHSPYGIASYAFLRAAQFHDIEGATVLAEVAREMVERLDAKEVAAKVENLIVGFVESRNRRLIELVEGYDRATRAGLEGGDSTFAAQGAVNAVSAIVASGIELEEAEDAVRPRMALCRRLGQERSVEWMALNRQLIDNLRGDAADPLVLAGAHMQVEPWLAVHEAGGDKAAPTVLRIYHAQLAIWTGDPTRGLDDVSAAEDELGALLGTLYVPICHAYAGLIRVAALREGGPAGLKRLAERSLKKLDPWVVPGPINFDHLRHLIRAELADLTGRWQVAEEAYDEAIRLASRTGVIHEAAMAMELAGRSWLRRGRGRIAAGYLRSALDRWRDYGALAGLERFDELFRQALELGADDIAPVAHAAGEGPKHDGVDAEVVRRGAQALVGEIRLESLLEKLLGLALQVSGATSGALLIVDDGQFKLAASADSRGGKLQVQAVARLSEATLAQTEGDFAAVANYVGRAREPVLADDVRQDPRFAAGAQGEGALSVLAAPLIRGGDLLGIVIAGQELVTSAFSERQLELVTMLASQAAVSVANSILYEDLQAALERQKALTQAYQRFVPAQFLEQLGKQSILEVKLGDQVQGEFHILFADIRAFSARAERLGPAATFRLINEYLAVMEPAITAHGGYIKEFQGDGILAVFSGSADDAVSGALAMHLALAQLNKARGAAGKDALRIGVGLNSGVLTFGAIGGLSRMASGVVGDAINAASRVEGMCKGYGAGLLISGETHARLESRDTYQLREVDRVQALGKQETMTIWEVLDGEPESLRRGKLEGRAAYARGLEAWRAGNFDVARDAFAGARRACPDDLAAALFEERCAELQSRPTTPDWDGVSRLSWK